MVKVGDKVNIQMKPATMRGWEIVKETDKCYIVRKRFDKRYGKEDYLGDCNYIPKKNIKKIEVIENE